MLHRVTESSCWQSVWASGQSWRSDDFPPQPSANDRLAGRRRLPSVQRTAKPVSSEWEQGLERTQNSGKKTKRGEGGKDKISPMEDVLAIDPENQCRYT